MNEKIKVPKMPEGYTLQHIKSAAWECWEWQVAKAECLIQSRMNFPAPDAAAKAAWEHYGKEGDWPI